MSSTLLSTDTVKLGIGMSSTVEAGAPGVGVPPTAVRPGGSDGGPSVLAHGGAGCINAGTRTVEELALPGGVGAVFARVVVSMVAGSGAGGPAGNATGEIVPGSASAFTS